MSKSECKALLRDAVLAWVLDPKRKCTWIIPDVMCDTPGLEHWKIANNASRYRRIGMKDINTVNGANWAAEEPEWALAKLAKEGWLHRCPLRYTDHGVYMLSSKKEIIARDVPKWEAEFRGESDPDFYPFFPEEDQP